MLRIAHCKSFAKSMNKLESEQMKIRVKEPMYVENISDVFGKIDTKWSKFHRKTVQMYMLDEKKYCCASGMLFVKATLSNSTLYLFQILPFFSSFLWS